MGFMHKSASNFRGSFANMLLMLCAIADFYSNKLGLTGLEVKPELDGCTYVTLPIRVRSLLNHRSLSFITIIPDSSFSPGEQTLLINIVAKRLGNKRDA